MKLNNLKLDKVFHETLDIITQLQIIDKDCNKENCSRQLKIHSLLLQCQKNILKLRSDLLDAIEVEEGEENEYQKLDN